MPDVTYGTSEVCAGCGEVVEAAAASFTSLDPVWRDADGRYSCSHATAGRLRRPHAPAGWECVIDRDKNGLPTGARWEVHP